MKLIKHTIAGLAFAAALPLVGFAEEEAAAPPGRLESATVTAIATVQEVDQESRLVTLRHPDGTMDSFIAGDEVRNLAQVKKGDVVLMEYYEGFAVALGPQSDVRAKVATMTLERAPEGEKPRAKLTETVEIVARVEEIDREKRLAALSGPKRTVVIKVADDIDLEKVNVGDEVMAVYRQSFAVSVQPAPEVSGNVEIESTSVALGVGFEWGKGTLSMYDGSTHEFKISGISVIDLGVSKISLSGQVFHLKDPADFPGKYISGEAGGALVGGGSGVVMKNEQGVLMRLTSKQEGLKLTLAGKGLSVEMVQ